MDESLTKRSQSLLSLAEEEAARLGHCYLGVEHVWNALSREERSSVQQYLQKLGLVPEEMRNALRREMGSGHIPIAGSFSISPRLAVILKKASQKDLNLDSIAEENFMYELVAEGQSLPIRYLQSIGFDKQTLLVYLKDLQSGEVANQTVSSIDSHGPLKTQVPENASAPLSSDKPGQKKTAAPGPSLKPKTVVPKTMPTPILDKMGRDLTKLARLGKINEVVGREKEIDQIITILARTKKANPLLLGEAGVGKTAIVEGLAYRIAKRNVPPILKGKRVVEIQMSNITAGTSLRGQFEERIRDIIKEASEATEVVLFIDEMHTIVGAGSSLGDSTDAAQMFKPPLARGDIACIGATTHGEYTKFIRKDSALERRFSPVDIKELTEKATLEVLEKMVPKIVEKQKQFGQGITVLPGALKAAVELTDQYIKDRHQPDKSLDAIDIACANAVVHEKSIVSPEDVAKVVSEWTGIPTKNLGREEKTKYSTMEEVLSKKVLGQASAVSAVSRSIRTAMAGMKDPNRPVGVFLFMGPSGVGKTHLAKELSHYLFDSPLALTRFDMTEYQDKHTLTNLIGSPKGYIGSDDGGQLTEPLRRKPYSVVLLDEIEKAHPDIFNIFLEVFDDGRITDNQGRVIDCSNALFILTSNFGTGEIDFADIDQTALRKKATEFLRPELVNRIDKVVGFTPLGKKELEGILELILTEKKGVVQKKLNINVTIDHLAKSLILQCNFDPALGARPLERAVEEMIFQPLVDEVFKGHIEEGDLLVTAPHYKMEFLSESKEDGRS